MAQRLTLQRTEQQAEERPSEGLFASLSGFDLVNILWSKRKLIGIVCGACTLLTIGIALLMPNKYASTATILPSGSSDKFADLKALAGLGGGSGADESSSELFPTILYSRSIQDAVLAKSYQTEDGQIMLTEYFGESNPDELRKELARVTIASPDRRTHVLTLMVETKDPLLSQGVATAYIEQLESYNMFTRRSKAKQNADYLARQLEEQNKYLGDAEDKLAAFQAENRDWAMTTSPEILKGLSRLQREVEVKSSAVLFLSQQYEVAKFDAQKDIPIVQVLDAPSLATAKSGPKRMVWVLLAACLSLFGICSLILLATVLRGLETGKTILVSQADTITLPPPVSRVARILAREETV